MPAIRKVVAERHIYGLPNVCTCYFEWQPEVSLRVAGVLQHVCISVLDQIATDN